MSEHEHETSAGSDMTCCAEYERASALTRRRFMAGMAAGVGAGVATTAFGGVFRQVVFGQTIKNNVLVVISLRGGIDGLSVVVPYKERNYYRSRPTIAVPEGALILRNHTFGMNPALRPLAKFWKQGRLAAVHATGLKVPDRSHFSAMEAVEDAAPGSAIRQGWVNRAIGLDSGSFPTEAVQFGTSIVPTALVGPEPSIATDSIAGLYLAAASPEWDSAQWRRRRRRQLETVWAHAPGSIGRAARSALRTVEQMEPYARQTYKPRHGVHYPTDWPAGDFSDAMKNTAQLIRADVGTEVVAVDYGSWDMHTDVGSVDGGSMTSMLSGFAKVLAAFLDDLDDLRSRVTVVTISEFGRRVDENSAGGLDHGWGNVMLLAGAGVKGGRYYARWPGLSPRDLGEGDLKVTTDYRDVLAEVVHDRLHRSTAKAFPGLRYRPIGVMRN
jgi:uncharacterized protein (DUF1501 family)